MADKMIIGLTGNIASGKSLVLRMLQELGATVIDADKLVHRLMKRGEPLYAPIVEEFGKFVVEESGEINRSRLGRIVFSDPDGLASLEAITHPAVREEILKRVGVASSQAVVVEAIKLFESGLAKICHSNWVVTAPADIRLQRLVDRRNMPLEQARQRIKAQTPEEEKVAQADVVIDNSSDLAKTWASVKRQFQSLLESQLAASSEPSAEATPVATPSSPVPETSPAVNPAKLPGEIDRDQIVIRRAKRDDLGLMAELITIGTDSELQPEPADMLEALFSRAYLVAEFNENVLGMIGWQTENLVAGLQDMYMMRPDFWPVVGSKMLERVHEEVNSLACEVALMFVQEQAGSKPIEFLQEQGYERVESQDLIEDWREAAQEWQPEDSQLLYKKMREQRIMVPM